MPDPRSEFDISHDYHKELLFLALTKAANGREIPKLLTKSEILAARAKNQLSIGEWKEVFWLGANQTQKENIVAVAVPTTRGLIGYRKLTIRKTSENVFNKIKTIKDLSMHIACQGSDWPDTKILQIAGLVVTTATIYENLFKMLSSKRCDYFPRGYHDAKTELKLRKELYPDLMSFDKLILHYPFAIYFYAEKTEPELLSWIEDGMRQLANEGKIEELMKTHPLTSAIYPLKNESNTVFIDITNPLLPIDTDVNNPVYWILPQDFNISVPAK